MRQVLFRIPLKPFDGLPDWWPENMPIYGFGMMLFVTFLVTTWMASRRAKKEGIAPQHVQDLALWIFVAGIVGARLVYLKQYGVPLSHFFMIWQGGLVFYGSAVGGVLGYFLGYWLIIRRHGLSTWKLADIIAPTVAVGLMIGRVGCLLNGCCYGNVACPNCDGVHFPVSAPAPDHTVGAFSIDQGLPAAHFPLSAPARYQLVGSGYQTAAGFLLSEKEDADARTVAAVDPNSSAAKSGLRAGDVIETVTSRTKERLAQPGALMPDGEVKVASPERPSYPSNLRRYLLQQWPQWPVDVELVLTVKRGNQKSELPAFAVHIPADPEKTDFGFTTVDCMVGEVDPASPAHRNGLRHGDIITRANDQPINFSSDLQHYLEQVDTWPRGLNTLELTVVHAGERNPVRLETFAPRTLGLHPTQLYESISMALLFLVLTAYYPLRRRDGMVMVLFTLGYSVHRFLNEMLRNDTDPIFIGDFKTGMTLSQNGSIFFFVVGLLLLIWLWRKPAVR
jgi:prolipoprotein diacylglyceryltransferase